MHQYNSIGTFISKIVLPTHMSNVTLTKLSSKGQIVIPQELREELNLKEGETFAVIGKKDTIILKKIAIPSAKEFFKRLHGWGVKFAAKKGIAERDLQAIIQRIRKK